MVNILVTGGAGYIGSVVIERLLETPEIEKITVLDNNSHYPSFGFPEKCELIKGDLRNHDDLKMALEEADAVLHFAAVVGDVACDKSPEKATEINVGCVEKLVNLSLKNGVKRIVFPSTCSIYGLQPNDKYVNEATEPNPTSVYGTTKLKAEHLLKKAHQENGLDTCILRLSTVYGPSSPLSMQFGIFANLFVLNACTTGCIKVYGGDSWRPLLFIKDVAEVFRTVTTAPSSTFSGETFNVGCDSENYTIRQVAEIVANEVPGTRIIEEPRPPDPRSYKVTFEKIQRVVGFKPQYTLRAGVQELRDSINKGVYANLLKYA